MRETKKRNPLRRSLACLMAAMLLIASIPATVFAETDFIYSEDEVDLQEEIEDLPDSGIDSEDEGKDLLDESLDSEEGKWDISKEESNIEESADDPDIASEKEQEILEAEDVILTPADATSPTVTIADVDSETGDFTVVIKGVSLGTGEKVIVPIWSADKQADLVWYTAVKEGTAYVVRTNISAHGYNTGIYNIHVYRKAKSGAMTFLVNTELNILPSAAGVTVEKGADGKSFQLTIQDLKTYGAERVVEFAVWSDVNGQDDLKWYKVQKSETGKWTVNVPLSNHKGTGPYLIHTYVKTKAGKAICVNETEYVVATPSADKVTAVQTETEKAKLKVTGIHDFETVASVQFAVWSDTNGQDDLKWYSQKTISSTGCSKTISLSDFSRTGLFHVHVYAKGSDGTMTLLGMTTMKVAGPECSSFTAETKGSTFTLTVKGVTAPFTVSSLVIPVWSKSDQSDLVWYTPEKDGDSYVVHSDSSKHKNNGGTYQAHLYVKDAAGKMYCIGKTTFTLDYSYSKLKASLNDEETSARISLVGLVAPEDLKDVRFAVWSDENGQDDLRWYYAKNSSGTWSYDVKITDHGSKGEYIVHCYLAKKDGSCEYLGNTGFAVTKEDASSVTVSDLNAEAGTWKIHISTASTVSDVRAAVWSKSDQSDIHWYYADEVAAGQFLVQADVCNHQYNSGSYQIHVYSYKADIPSLVGTTTAKIEISNMISITEYSKTSYTVTIRGASYDGTAATAVVCPTWSIEGGQDDLVWYQAKKQADGSFTVTVLRSNHDHDGQYITDVYVKDASGSQKMAGRVTSHEMTGDVREFDEAAREVMRNIIYAVETGGQVYGNKRYDDFTEAYKNSSKETAITIGAGAWYATEAKTLLTRIRNEYPITFAKYDTAGIGEDLDNENWKYYGSDGAGNRTILKGSAKAVAIQNIIKSPGGIVVQDALIDEQMTKYTEQAKSLGVTDLKARLFCANIEHLGGYSAMVRVINYCISDGDPLTMENLWTNMREREAGSGTKVGSDIYKTRHMKVMTWLDTYL